MKIEEVSAAIGVAALIGAFIDFYIGKKGQKSLNSFLEELWIKLSYVTLRDIARKEADIATRILLKIFGRGIFSCRRMVVVFFSFMSAVVFVFAIGRLPDVWNWNFIGILGLLIIHFTRISISLTISVIAARWVAKLETTSILMNLLLIFLLFLVQCLIAYAPVFTESMFFSLQDDFISRLQLSITSYIYNNWKGVYGYNVLTMFIIKIVLLPLNYSYGIVSGLLDLPTALDLVSNWRYHCSFQVSTTRTELFALLEASFTCVEYGFSFLRLLILFIFLITLSLHPFHKFIMNIFARIVESDKPIFTFVAGGGVALFKVIQEVIKLF